MSLNYSFLLIIVLKVSCYDYNGYSLYGFEIRKQSDIEVLDMIDNKFYYVDYWFRQDHVGGRVHMFVGPNISKEVSIILDRANIPYNVTTKNWFPSSEKKRSRRTKLGEIDLYDFNSYDDIIEHLYKLEDRYKEFIKMKEIGKSYEGRSMYSFTIGYPSGR